MIREYSAFAAEAIREGIRDHEVDAEVEVILVLEMIFGAIDSIVLRWLFFNQAYDPIQWPTNSAPDQGCHLASRGNPHGMRTGTSLAGRTKASFNHAGSGASLRREGLRRRDDFGNSRQSGNC